MQNRELHQLPVLIFIIIFLWILDAKVDFTESRGMCNNPEGG